MKLCPLFFLVWMLCVFMFGYCWASGAVSGEGLSGGLPRFFRASNKKKKSDLYLWALCFSLMLAYYLSSLSPKGRECIGAVIKMIFTNGLEGWQAGGVALAFIFHGAFPVLLFDLIKDSRAQRNVYRFLMDCRTEGFLHAIHEKTSVETKWVVHNIGQDGYNLLQLAKRAAQGYYYKPVLIVLNIPAEQLLQKLEQYNLVTKNGYMRLPPPKSAPLFPEGGSIVHFYYQAEYVRIWG